jgi:type IV pilus assembly protein PilM
VFLFGGKSKNALGIDIGTTAVKLVQLYKGAEKPELVTYGEIRLEGEVGEETIQSASLTMPPKEISEMIRELIKETKAKAKNVTLSIPVFEAFINLIEVPVMGDKELAQALPFTARQYVPIPVEEVTLDWQIIGEKKIDSEGAGKIEVLLIAVPNDTIKRVGEIAKLSRFDLKAIEVESFGLARALVGQDTTATCIVDMGAKSSDIVIVDNGFVRASHNFDTAGFHISDALARTMNVSFQRAESIKHDRGLNLSQGEKDILEVITPLLDLIVIEIQQIVADYAQNKGRNIEKIILSGGSAQLPGIIDYLADSLNLTVSAANPFHNFDCPPALASIVEEIGPSFAVAAGLAMRGL